MKVLASVFIVGVLFLTGCGGRVFGSAKVGITFMPLGISFEVKTVSEGDLLEKKDKKKVVLDEPPIDGTG